MRNLDGTAKTDVQADVAIRRICRRAGLPVRHWHTLRHTFGTHAALFGMNPWRLQTWLGHNRIDETMLYIHVAEAHARELPAVVREAGLAALDPTPASSRCSAPVAKPWQRSRAVLPSLLRNP